jgi:hypothetical protein
MSCSQNLTAGTVDFYLSNDSLLIRFSYVECPAYVSQGYHTQISRIDGDSIKLTLSVAKRDSILLVVEFEVQVGHRISPVCNDEFSSNDGMPAVLR